LREQAAKRGGREFLVFPNRGVHCTFGDVDNKADAIAKGLLAAGFKKGDHIGIWAYNIPEWAPVLYAAARIGVVTVPVNVNCKERELGFILGQADIAGLFMVDTFRGTDLVNSVYQVIPELKTGGADGPQSARFPALRLVVAFDNTSRPGIQTLAELIARGKTIDDSVLRRAEAAVSRDDVLAIVYTSGTTGFPRGAVLTHRNLISNGYNANRLRKINEQAVILNPLPFFYITPLTGGLVESLVWGYKLVVLEGFDPLRCLEVIQAERCSWIFGVPTMYMAMLAHPRFGEFSMESAEYACIGGAMCPPDLLQKIIAAMGLKGLHIGYGLTETSPFITDIIIEDSSDPRLATVGDPIPGVEVSIRDPAAGTLCPPGEQGEICARGHNVMNGYYKAEDATREAIDSEGWFHTGDLGHLLPSGCLVVDGRKKEMIIRGGEKVFPKEVENLLLSMPGVQDAQVAGIPSEKYGEEVGAFIVLKPGMTLNEEDVRSFCKDTISRYKVPRYVFFVETYPLSANGKVQKFKLGEMGLRLLRETADVV
jgi:fatty-acyl-CoA synthase